MTVDLLAQSQVKQTHVEVNGTVAYAQYERDGDLHIRLMDPNVSGRFIVVECIPELPCRRPKVGQVITVRGITRFDLEHKWWEVHPAEEIK